MIWTIILIWMLATFPMVRATLKHMEEQGRQERNELLFQIILIGQSMIYVPYYYFLVTMEFITKLFKKR
jgi:hypothetical protein